MSSLTDPPSGPPPGPPPAAPPNQPGWAQAPAGKSYKGMAIGALVCGIISLLVAGMIVGPVGIVLGVIARKGMRDNNNHDGYGIALGGIITGAIGAVLALLIILVAISHR
jgi:hypothetical protein